MWFSVTEKKRFCFVCGILFSFPAPLPENMFGACGPWVITLASCNSCLNCCKFSTWMNGWQFVEQGRGYEPHKRALNITRVRSSQNSSPVLNQNEFCCTSGSGILLEDSRLIIG
ncbi:hypothetical protein AVEN_207890-1 [Araneus ventricosus]|uniref:Uncharacterized protein n=1 Tax=Araneus ventricosus TaxID=182803 RepID=A0A4Y2RGK6_ARAVE|nr:hypothetical protein AVEN_192721-1 [Araneus ventricosus]GBN74781.1 hypothetical protein AVEN_207890-1 [Araneus ventricosus]